MKKKILSVLMTVAMLLSMTAMFAGTVSANNVDLTDGIDNYDELEAFVNSLATKDYAGETVTLNADITVNEGWTADNGASATVTAPTGDNAKVLDTTAITTAFAGTFDGNGKTISGLYINGLAFIPYVTDATIKNVTFENCATVYPGTLSKDLGAAIVAGNHTSGNPTFTGVVVKDSKVVENVDYAFMGTILGKAAAGTVKLDGCKSIDGNLYSNKSAGGGMIGKPIGSTTEIKNCFNSSDVYMGDVNYSNAGGMVGEMQTGTLLLDGCVNDGAIKSAVYVGGMVGNDISTVITATNCINSGDITALQEANSKIGIAAGGILGRVNQTGCTVSNCINLGTVSATNMYAIDTNASATKYDHNGTPGCAGGIVGGTPRKNYSFEITLTNCLNAGNVSANEYAYARAGGAIGEHWGPLAITNFVNTGDVYGYQKAGGVVGYYDGTTGTLEKAINTGTITGLNRTEARIERASGAAFGQWEKAVDGENEVNIIDFFYSNSGYTVVIGLWQGSAKAVANYTASYTAAGVSLDFEPTVTNADVSSTADNLAKYSEFFAQNGYAADPAELYAEKGVNTFKAFNLGVDWILTDTIPVPASVFALLENKTLETGSVDYLAYQTNVGGTTFSVRIVAGLNSIDCANTGFELYLVKAGEEALYADMNSTTVYTSLKVYDAEGNPTTPYTNADYAYLSAITVNCSADDLGDVNTLIVKPYITVGGAKLYGDSCAIMIEKDGGALSVAGQYIM